VFVLVNSLEQRDIKCWTDEGKIHGSVVETMDRGIDTVSIVRRSYIGQKSKLMVRTIPWNTTTLFAHIRTAACFPLAWILQCVAQKLECRLWNLLDRRSCIVGLLRRLGSRSRRSCGCNSMKIVGRNACRTTSSCKKEKGFWSAMRF